jgi:competence protein ComFC
MKFNFFENLFNFFSPEKCVSCFFPISSLNKFFCLKCLYNIPICSFVEDNKIYERLIYCDNLCKSFSFFPLKGEDLVERFIYSIKYQNNFFLSYYFGSIFYDFIKNYYEIEKIDYVIPVPLHPKKYKKRGYNQSEFFAKGIISKNKNLKLNKSLVRKKNTDSQTLKNFFERKENMNFAFDLVLDKKQKLENKNILLVDDIVTTGATINESIKVLNKIFNIKINVATIAIAI